MGVQNDDKHYAVFDAYEGVLKDIKHTTTAIKIGDENLVDPAAARCWIRNHNWWTGAKYVKLINIWELKQFVNFI